MQNLRMSLVLGLAALLGPAVHRIADRPSARPERKRRKRMNPNYGLPHQSDREKARRIGGKTWADFRANDRKRRGLEA